MLNATFNNNSGISWRSILLVWIRTDCTGSYKSKYHAITTQPPPPFFRVSWNNSEISRFENKIYTENYIYVHTHYPYFEQNNYILLYSSNSVVLRASRRDSKYPFYSLGLTRSGLESTIYHTRDITPSMRFRKRICAYKNKWGKVWMWIWKTIINSPLKCVTVFKWDC